MSDIDFPTIKARVPIERVALEMLRLPMTEKKVPDKANPERMISQWRSVCPACRSRHTRALVVTPAKGMAYCWDMHKGGDCIWLVAHICKIRVREAALAIIEHFKLDQEEPEQPQKPACECRSYSPRKCRMKTPQV
jgi:CHC2 zinc finger